MTELNKINVLKVSFDRERTVKEDIAFMDLVRTHDSKAYELIKFY